MTHRYYIYIERKMIWIYTCSNRTQVYLSVLENFFSLTNYKFITNQISMSKIHCHLLNFRKRYFFGDFEVLLCGLHILLKLGSLVFFNFIFSFKLLQNLFLSLQVIFLQTKAIQWNLSFYFLFSDYTCNGSDCYEILTRILSKTHTSSLPMVVACLVPLLISASSCLILVFSSLFSRFMLANCSFNALSPASDPALPWSLNRGIVKNSHIISCYVASVPLHYFYGNFISILSLFIV